MVVDILPTLPDYITKWGKESPDQEAMVEFEKRVTYSEFDKVTDNIAKIVLEEMFRTGASPESIIDEKDLKPIHDSKLLQDILEKAIAENSNVVEQIKAGKINSINFIIGKVMSETGGKANPQKVRELVEAKLLI